MRSAVATLALSGLLLAIAATPSAQNNQVRATAAPAVQPDALPDRIARARDNLEALRAERLSTSQLSVQELQDVIDLERQVRGAGFDNRTVRQKCIDDEVRRNRGKPSQLAWEVIRMKCR